MSGLDYALVAAGVVAGYLALAWLAPALLRPAWWVLAHLLYRFTVHGRDKVPASGGSLQDGKLNYPSGWIRCFLPSD